MGILTWILSVLIPGIALEFIDLGEALLINLIVQIPYEVWAYKASYLRAEDFLGKGHKIRKHYLASTSLMVVLLFFLRSVQLELNMLYREEGSGIDGGFLTPVGIVIAFMIIGNLYALMFVAPERKKD